MHGTIKYSKYVGRLDGISLGLSDGTLDGITDGMADGCSVGCKVGYNVGVEDGDEVGFPVISWGGMPGGRTAIGTP